MELNQNEVEKKIELEQDNCSSLFHKLKQIEQEIYETKEAHTDATAKLKALKVAKLQLESKGIITRTNTNLDSEWVDPKFRWTLKLKRYLKGIFNFEEFRPKQLAAINATLSKRDVIVVMPTGGGKSLIYQLPALIDEGLTIVVSPLISLINDQLMACERYNIEATTINCDTGGDEIKKIFELMTDKKSTLKVLYITPEYVAKSKRFLSILKKCNEKKRIARVAIDEIHCCSKWGHDFRSDYALLNILRSALMNVPFLGLTATATMNVLMDVQTILNLQNCLLITVPFNRPNLYYNVIVKCSVRDENVKFLEELLKDTFKDETGIIYTNTAKESEALASSLRQAGLKVAAYYAELEPQTKCKIHKKWIEKRYHAIIADATFGMGIDKPDVRFVIHFTLPRSMESLYQESGRSGRNSQRADCIVLFDLSDFLTGMALANSPVEEKKAFEVLDYCLDQQSCRRSLIAKHLEETWDSSDCNKMCDHCNRTNANLVNYDITVACKDILTLLDLADQNKGKLTFNKLLEAWFQIGSKKFIDTSLEKPMLTKQQGEYILSHLILKKYLEIVKGYASFSIICYARKGKKPETGKIEILTKFQLPGFFKRPYFKQDKTEPLRKML